MKKILVIDDEPNVHYSFKRLFGESYRILQALGGKKALSEIRRHKPHLVILDIQLGDMNGLDVLKEIKKAAREIPVIIITAFSSYDQTIQAMQYGAYDYQIKPFDIPGLRTCIERALALGENPKKKKTVKKKSASHHGEYTLVGNSEAMQKIYKMIGTVAAQDITVLIRGESGTGKELVARAIHRHSHRASQAFISMNSAALPEQLLESEFFGHEKGSFTGAHSRHIGKFEQAAGGTLFLDEIGDMPVSTQTKILRVIQEGEYTRVGGRETLRADVRLIVATHQNLEEAILNRTFREDLYYRLNVFAISMPPLRKRMEDMPALVKYFMRMFSDEFKRDICSITPGAMNMLKQHTWPGNIRELENTLKRSMILCKGEELGEDDIHFLPNAHAVSARKDNQELDMIFEEMLENSPPPLYPVLEKKMLEFALKKNRNNQVKAAALLGINRNTLRSRMQKYGIE